MGEPYLPERIAVDAAGFYWRVVSDEMWSMCPTNSDNSPIPEPVTFYVRDGGNIEQKYRRELWLNHGHPFSALYGDDGEMQCHTCPFDFKREGIEACEQQRVIVRSAQMRASTGGK